MEIKLFKQHLLRRTTNHLGKTIRNLFKKFKNLSKPRKLPRVCRVNAAKNSKYKTCCRNRVDYLYTHPKDEN